MILSGKKLLDRISKEEIIFPYVDHKVRELRDKKAPASFGLSEAGYDLRMGLSGIIVDDKLPIAEPLSPFNASDALPEPIPFSDYEIQNGVVIPPQSVLLTVSYEYIKMPPDLIGIAVGKSTYARLGIVANVTPIEPGWEGYLVIELSNTFPLPVKVFPLCGIVQVTFHEISDVVNYSGKYQGQEFKHASAG